MFITFEGLDGSGKSTQLRRLAEALRTEGYEVVTTRQPGGTALGDRIRSILVDSRSEAEFGGIDAVAELTLMFADRAQSLAQIILPAVDRGAIVLCDRYTDSSEAYQGAGRELGPERVLALHRCVCNDIWPSLTVLLLPSLEKSLQRARRRNERNTLRNGTDEGRFEGEKDVFFERAYAQYEAIARRCPERVVQIGDGSIEEIAARILDVTQQRLAAVRR